MDLKNPWCPPVNQLILVTPLQPHQLANAYKSLGLLRQIFSSYHSTATKRCVVYVHYVHDIVL